MFAYLSTIIRLLLTFKCPWPAIHCTSMVYLLACEHSRAKMAFYIFLRTHKLMASKVCLTNFFVWTKWYLGWRKVIKRPLLVEEGRVAYRVAWYGVRWLQLLFFHDSYYKMALFLPKSLFAKLFGRNTNIVISLTKLDTILKWNILLTVLDGSFLWE